ncbi:RNA dependent RNA polymerase-domain-containing protein [Jimgerdemannia flammicorona]|uniref:RNA-dependent RNA polymerase n=1 Tax=Jimgerdemannia flammicorona TaxID=994334 RepID=A0A433QGK1_9FUNG|nr:RNA dependent RNA polymerase-domain-containing protein [Jimgerdemannia flammicorona]
MWDPNLLPPIRNYEAMSFKSSYKPGEVDKVEILDIKRFFVNYILNDNLGMIANAHLAHADKSPEGAKDGRCLKLAQLHSIAVDFPKTGNPAIFKSDLRATEFPDFMGKKDKPMYESKKVLGIIYRSIQASDYKEYQSTLTNNLRFDSRLIVTGFQRYVTDARLQKRDYDRGIQSLQNQYGVRTESEIVSGYIMKYLKSGKKREFKLHKQAMDASNHFRHQFLRRFDQEFCREGSTAPTPEARRDREVKASAWYYVTYHPSEIAKFRARNRDDEPRRFSFPWLVWELLCEIAKRNEKSARAVTDAQVAALPAVVAQYEAENGLSESDEFDDDDESEYDVPSVLNFSMTKSGLAVASGTSFGPAQHAYVGEFAQRNLVGIRATGVVPEGDLLGLNDAF